MNNLNYPLRVNQNNTPFPFFENINDETDDNEENIENNIVFCITLEKHLQSNQYQDLFFEIRHIGFLFFYFG